jgi:hypothetical protein
LVRSSRKENGECIGCGGAKFRADAEHHESADVRQGGYDLGCQLVTPLDISQKIMWVTEKFAYAQKEESAFQFARGSAQSLPRWRIVNHDLGAAQFEQGFPNFFH